jgi:hypothetical protein
MMATMIQAMHQVKVMNQAHKRKPRNLRQLSELPVRRLPS